jgi:hypothetical protein
MYRYLCSNDLRLRLPCCENPDSLNQQADFDAAKQVLNLDVSGGGDAEALEALIMMQLEKHGTLIPGGMGHTAQAANISPAALSMEEQYTGDNACQVTLAHDDRAAASMFTSMAPAQRARGSPDRQQHAGDNPAVTDRGGATDGGAVERTAFYANPAVPSEGLPTQPPEGAITLHQSVKDLHTGGLQMPDVRHDTGAEEECCIPLSLDNKTAEKHYAMFVEDSFYGFHEVGTLEDVCHSRQSEEKEFSV